MIYSGQWRAIHGSGNQTPSSDGGTYHLGTLTIKFVNYGGYTWTAKDRIEIYQAFTRVISRCEAIAKTVQKEIARVKATENPATQKKVLPELEFLLNVVDKIIALPTSDSTLYIYYYKLPPDADDSGLSNPLLLFSKWIAIDNGLPLDGSEDATLFHELTHVFADSVDNDNSGLLHNQNNSSSTGNRLIRESSTRSKGIRDWRRIRQLLQDARKPKSVPTSPYRRRGYGHLWTE